ncbi:TetR family transcriptional regulator [Massilia sp. Root418]|uniref:TetR/AcrR family transcriptional regulator n=1 Tax=Massilia sp. Root418 TaxID=1736532 RepID=UPI0006FFF1BF|nr:TetR/AcrR family transcriptional regulator [Massilia sp. Root418]KQW93628.1 TetR family transcriptional regulator [Massilia sp. Root418]
MSTTPPKRLSKEMRREQMLETARRIVREEGTDLLTLGYLAERAGVSKPIAYEHFETRSGLLIALYKQFDDQQAVALHEALKRTPKQLKDVAALLGAAYVDCYKSMGPEWHAISAALKGDERMEAFQQELIDSYVDIYCGVFAPYCDLPKKELRLRCVGIIGAAEAITREMQRGRVAAGAAATAIASLMVSWLGQGKTA